MGIPIANLNSIVAESINSSYSDSVIKNKYENNSDTNVFTDAEKTKLAGVENGATQKGALTALSIANNVLSYVDENGTTTTINLAGYLDNTTNTVSSGTVNSSTGIATFTRQDSTTFTLDLSTLLDNQIASDVPYTNITSGLSATNVQSALDEIVNNTKTGEWN